ncbi:MAG: AraC family transcriptional regulator [Bacteroidales bacterium]|nr:AraC family transcriptional regulator [Bacteroidales bacterium]
MQEKEPMDYSIINDRSFWYGEIRKETLPHYLYKTVGGFVLLCTNGKATITIGIQEHEITKNAELVILPGTTFGFVNTSLDFAAKAFTFSKELYDNIILRLGASFSRYLRDTQFYVYTEESELLKKVQCWMDMAKIVQEENNDFKGLMEQNFLQNYILYLYDKCKLYFDHLVGTYTRKHEIFHQFISLLDTHISEHREVLFYADKLCITPRYLRKITTENVFSESPKVIIDKRLIVEIKVLLQSTELSIQEIADKLNFPDQSYLSRYFKMNSGITPTDYRNGIKVVKY